MVGSAHALGHTGFGGCDVLGHAGNVGAKTFHRLMRAFLFGTHAKCDSSCRYENSKMERKSKKPLIGR